MKRTCIKPGCERGIATGHALHRTSPKGEEFVGACTEHASEYQATVEPVAQIIEEENQR
jgi:hypothetical protein